MAYQGPATYQLGSGVGGNGRRVTGEPQGAEWVKMKWGTRAAITTFPLDWDQKSSGNERTYKTASGSPTGYWRTWCFGALRSGVAGNTSVTGEPQCTRCWQALENNRGSGAPVQEATTSIWAQKVSFPLRGPLGWRLWMRSGEIV